MRAVVGWRCAIASRKSRAWSNTEADRWLRLKGCSVKQALNFFIQTFFADSSFRVLDVSQSHSPLSRVFIHDCCASSCQEGKFVVHTVKNQRVKGKPLIVEKFCADSEDGQPSACFCRSGSIDCHEGLSIVYALLVHRARGRGTYFDATGAERLCSRVNTSKEKSQGTGYRSVAV